MLLLYEYVAWVVLQQCTFFITNGVGQRYAGNKANLVAINLIKLLIALNINDAN
jgi:presenilin-like A22 family membrane protease